MPRVARSRGAAGRTAHGAGAAARARRPLASLSLGAPRQPPAASRGATAGKSAAAPGAREASAPRRPAARGAAAAAALPQEKPFPPPLAPPGGCRLHSPSSSSLRPSPRSSHIIAPLSRPRASSAGGSETQPRGDDGGAGRAGCPRGLGVGWRGGGPLGAAGRLATKTRFAKLCNSSILLLTINLRARLQASHA